MGIDYIQVAKETLQEQFPFLTPEANYIIEVASLIKQMDRLSGKLECLKQQTAKFN